MEQKTVKEILHQQLELLAEFSQYEGNDARDLAELTNAMARLATSIDRMNPDGLAQSDILATIPTPLPSKISIDKG